MSAEQSPIAVLHPPGGQASDAPGNELQPAEEAAPSDAGLPIATADLANLLANGQWGDIHADQIYSAADAGAYDGHVALALDTGVLPAIDSALDMLTSSHHLFDVPALDVSSDPGDASST